MTPGEVRLLPIDAIAPCPVQPRVNLSVRLIRDMASSIKDGMHEPVVEVETLPGDRYQIVCGEQRWRAARVAGRAEVLALVRPRLSYLERLLKQAQENRLRVGLDPVEEAHCILAVKTLLDIQRAEQLLDEAGVDHPRLDQVEIVERDGFARHLDVLKALLNANRISRPLSSWAACERALGISESARKQKVGILRLAPEVQEEVRGLPAEHAIQISRLSDPTLQAELAEHAADLTHREVRQAVDELRENPERGVAEVLSRELEPPAAPDPTAFTTHLQLIEELGRQLVRRLRLLPSELDRAQSRELSTVLAGVREQLERFG